MKRKPPKVTIQYPKGRRPQLAYKVDGRWVRVTAGSLDSGKIEQERAELEARLVLGLVPTKSSSPGQTGWLDFRAQYTSLHLSTLRLRARRSVESRLNIVERICKPVDLVDMTDRKRLDGLVTSLRAGDKRGPRSLHTIRGIMGALTAALTWAARQGLIDSVPALHPVRAAKSRTMKGRPITTEEFERMLRAVPRVLAGILDPEAEPEKNRTFCRYVPGHVEAWEFTLQGLWTSGLRLGELMSMHWTDPNEIVPQLGRLPTLSIPAARQKNDTEESVPILPEFAALLRSIPDDEREGWIFQPTPIKRRYGIGRLTVDNVSKTITNIGRVAGVVVLKTPTVKHASAHDLRRSVAQRMIDAGVSIYTVQAVMRHADFKTTQRHYGSQTVSRAASELADKLQRPTHTVTCDAS